MIPANITCDDIRQAMREIDDHGVPVRRQSNLYDILYNGTRYPPKYTIGLANRFANGRELEYTRFNGGEEANSFLLRRGFAIVPKQ